MTRFRRGAVAGALLGAVGLALGVAADPAAAAFSYLAAIVAALTVALGALALVLVTVLTDATWFVALRRLAETIAGTMPVLVVLTLPIVVAAPLLYPWVRPEALDAHARELVMRKEAYLNLPFWAVRAAAYLMSWLAMFWCVRRWLRRREREGLGPPWLWTAIAAIVLAFTTTFASFDWLMSLRPSWSSTIYGVRVWAGGLVSALAAVAVLMRVGNLPVRDVHVRAVGSLLISFLLFWAYIAFSQLLVIWIGNEPDEITWYLARREGWALAAGVVLAVGHFLAPFLMLLFRQVKDSPRAMARLGLLLLALHWVDVCWLVLPEAGAPMGNAVWIAPAAALLVVSAAILGGAWVLGDAPLLPVGDPELGASLNYEEAG